MTGRAARSFEQHRQGISRCLWPFMMHTADNLLAATPMLLLLLLAARTDLRSGRIPNNISFSLILLGVAHASLCSLGWLSGASLTAAWAGLALGLGLTLVFFLIGALGGGDVKLMAG